MKLISLNIENCLHIEGIIEFLKKESPDVICLQEVLEINFTHLKESLGFEATFQTCRYERSHHYPHAVGKKLGVAIFSKKIEQSGALFYLGKEEYTFEPFDEKINKISEALVWADIKDESGEIYRFATAHLPVTHHGESTPFQLEAARYLSDKLDTLSEFTLAGDMNAPRGNETFGLLAEKYTDNIPTTYKTSLDQNLHKVKGLQYMVDGLFTTPNYKTKNVKLIDGVSDHMAIVADIYKS